jgi:hypothetical protein
MGYNGSSSNGGGSLTIGSINNGSTNVTAQMVGVAGASTLNSNSTFTELQTASLFHLPIEPPIVESLGPNSQPNKCNNSLVLDLFLN